ncbi:hypothetical protein FB45DRAFT_914027 [Roridomyces roridus]|uniref:Uncharacterized protein n=1 Tax=Roridomyces roridus TaxID=1738132 RepID=A0AAD7BX92_9AGAR|nr:hypothetical protein FB45DRAFT_914027 [Roridomyces roridus]
MLGSPSTLSLLRDKDLPDAPIELTPLRKHSTRQLNRWSRELLFTQQPIIRPSEGRARWILTAPALVIMLLTLIISTIFLLYLAVIGGVHNFDTSAVYLSKPTSNILFGLTITTISTHFVCLSAPFLISVAAYGVAGTWLQEQEFPRHSQVALPTPLQYAFMFKLLASPNITAVWGATQYMRGSRQRLRFPRAFHIALIVTSLILGLSYLLILADIWLHGSASVIQGTLPLASNKSLWAVNTSSALATEPQSGLLGRYPLAPIIIYLYLLYTYAFTAGGIYLWASRIRTQLFRTPGRKTTSAVQLAQVRLTDPLALVAALYPRDCPTPEDGPEMFPLVEDERATGRLEMGIKNDGAGRGNTVSRFGVFRRAGPGTWGVDADALEVV